MDLGVKYGKCMCEMDPEFKEKMMSGGGSFWRSFVKGMKKGAQMALPIVAVTNPELTPAVMAGEAALSQKQQGGGALHNLLSRLLPNPEPAAEFKKKKGGGRRTKKQKKAKEEKEGGGALPNFAKEVEEYMKKRVPGYTPPKPAAKLLRGEENKKKRLEVAWRRCLLRK